MTAVHHATTRRSSASSAPERRWPTVAVVAAVVAGVALAVAHARVGVGSSSIAAPPGIVRVSHPLFGYEHWPRLFELVSLAVMVTLCATYGIRSWRRGSADPYLLMIGALTGIIFLDPLMNWIPYVTYDGRTLHWPTTWGWASISPTVEPLAVFVGYAYFYLLPTVPAMRLQRRLARRGSQRSFASRHPLLTLFLLTTVIGFVWDAGLEMLLVQTQLYLYAQVMPWGSVLTGSTHQFPLLWESLPTGLMMAGVAVLLWKDDTGRTTAERLARRWRLRPRRQGLATMGVMFAVMTVVYLGYSLPLLVIRLTGNATAVAKPWPYATQKVYDPDGRWQRACETGPFYAGTWANRPTVSVTCAP